MRIGSIIPITEVLDKVKNEPGKTFTIQDETFKKTQSMIVFANKGTTCVCCKREAAYFMFFDDSSGRYLKLMLYHNQVSGQPNFMTKDHIIPKAHGGINVLDNYQPMCAECNNQKGTVVDMLTVPPVTITHLPANRQRKWFNRREHTISITSDTVESHKCFIVQYALINHPHAKFGVWTNGIRALIMQAHARSYPNQFVFKAFNTAFDLLTKEVIAQPGEHKEKKPARIFQQLGYDNP